MAISNKDRISRTLDLLRDGLVPFVERELKAKLGSSWLKVVNDSLRESLRQRPDGTVAWDTQGLFTVMEKWWGDVFRFPLGRVERSYINELRETRNDFVHDKTFTYDDTERALDTAQRLLRAVSAGREADGIERLRVDLRRTIYDEQRRQQVRRQAPLTLEGTPKAGLRPWREVITPHADVATGRYSEAEFAADLAQVDQGQASAEYGDPAEFYRRTFLTDGLRRLLTGAMRRLSRQGGDPVVDLQTNFGGGKTHSMLALYHLAGPGEPGSLPGLDQLMAEVGVQALPHVHRAALVGTALSPGEPTRHEDGVATRTLWGELAWQLGRRDGYAMVAESDQARVSPGSRLLGQLLERYSPALLLIDEWVAFVRQLYANNELAAGTFDSNMTFVQALSEAVKATSGALLVASLPASQIEIGGEGGEVALERLKNTFGRIESSWRPATPEEGFEIVRRRLFEPMVERELFAARDNVVKAFADLYRESGAAFPAECSEADYRRRLEAAYPIHPELFDRLNNDWGSLDRFQRTRGVLRLMAAVINALWEQGDKGLMIMPASIPLHEPTVLAELTRYLEQKWDAIISADVDGPNATPLAIDRENPNLQRYGAARRVARTIFMASAPTYGGPNPGIDDRRIRLGSTQPGETPGSFGDALRRLADRATFLYVDAGRYWLSTQPSVTRTADDRAAALEADDVWPELIKRLRQDRERGPFAAVHVVPENSGEVPDEMEARLVVLGPDYPHDTVGESKAKAAAEEILRRRGQQPRIYRNALLFLAPDRRRLGELEQAMRFFMAWRSIVQDQETLNLDAFQRRQADSKATEWEKTVTARVGETWVWAMAPHQPDPKQPGIEWVINRVNGQDSIAKRASKRFESDEALLIQLGPGRLRKALDQFGLWRDQDHVEIKQVIADFATYLYLPRLRDRQLVMDAIRAAISQLVCDHFAYADSLEETRYVGLVATGSGAVVIDPFGLIVKSQVALAQRGKTPPPPPPPPPQPTSLPRHFYASVAIDPDRAGRDVGRIAEEVIQHLTTSMRADVKLTLEIEADAPEGMPENIRRVVTENCQTLKFITHGFR
jgi:predicted AAA+ superfamily ATPase